MINACIPIAVQVVIDDVGWWSGNDGSKRGEPYRTGIGRDHIPEDYEAIAALGKRLNMRPQAAMILCEWDRTNMLRELPSATWMADRWDNSRWIGPWLDKAARIIRDDSDHMEITLHGIGHEYWENGVMTRAEWHDSHGNMRPAAEISAHLEFYKKLLQQNRLGDFPESFVPAAFLHRFGTGGEGLEKILADHGIKYISTPYQNMFKSQDTQGKYFGSSNGILTVDRGHDLFSWNVIGRAPEGETKGPVCGMHWPNILHEDPERNLEVVDSWVKLLSKYNSRFDRMLAGNTAEAFSQVVYNWGISLTTDEKGLTLNFEKMSCIHAEGLLDSFHVKVEGCFEPLSISAGLKLLTYAVDTENRQTALKFRRVNNSKEERIELKAIIIQ